MAYALSDTHTSRRGRDTGEVYEPDGVTNAIQRMTVRCGGRQGRTIEIAIDPDRSPSEIRRQVVATCAGL